MWYRTSGRSPARPFEKKILQKLTPPPGTPPPNLHPGEESAYRADGSLGFWVLPNGVISQPVETHNYSADRALLHAGAPRKRPMAKDDLMAHANALRLNTSQDHTFGEFQNPPTPQQLSVMENEYRLLRGWGNWGYQVYHPATGRKLSEGKTMTELQQEPWNTHFAADAPPDAGEATDGAGMDFDDE